MKRFRDFANARPQLEGAKIDIDNILNEEIIITGFKIGDSKFKKPGNDKYERIQFEYSSKKEGRFVFFTGSTVLRRQLEEHGDRIPFITTIIKINRYYTMS